MISIPITILTLALSTSGPAEESKNHIYDEQCQTLAEVTRAIADSHQYGGDDGSFFDELRKNGVTEETIARYAKIQDEIAQSPRLLTEDERAYIIDYQVEYYERQCLANRSAPAVQH